MNKLLSIGIVIVITIFSNSCSKDDDNLSGGTNISTNEISGTFTDSRDSTIYKWVKIGNQVWMAENLAYTGNDIRHITFSSEWSNNTHYDGWCYYRRNSNNANIYGILYQWAAAKIACPNGWLLPTDNEWTELENYLVENGYSCDGIIGHLYIAKSLAKDSIWETTENHAAIGNHSFPDYNNKTGFSALPSGFRNNNSYAFFDKLKYHGYWWSATEPINNNMDAWIRNLGYNSAEIFRYASQKNHGYAVRCIKP